MERKEVLFDRFGINPFAEVKVGDLSTGMKQKTSIAISLVHNPDFIIFDEPTNGLDVLTARSVTDYLLELKEQQKTVILSTHILSVVEKLCDRVGIIINGKMKVCDTTENVKLLGCITCDGPVASTVSQCNACGSPLSGKELKYIARHKPGPDIQGMLKWWGIWSLGIFALGGFNFSVAPMSPATSLSTWVRFLPSIINS